MRIGRTLPPAAAPLDWRDLCQGARGLCASGRPVAALEDSLRRHFGVNHVFLLSSGKAALALTLAALKSLSPRTDVVMPAYTCFSVPAAAIRARLRPAPCDVDASTFDFDPHRLAHLLNGNTLCVVAHHLFGMASDIERLRPLCRERGIVIVEDAAQAMGVTSQGRMLGTLGDVGIFSLGRGKHLTCGSGGIVITRSDRIASAIIRQMQDLPVPSMAGPVCDLARAAAIACFVRPRLFWIPAAVPLLRLGETLFPRTIPLEPLSGVAAGLLRDWPARLARSNEARAEISADLCDRLSLQPASGQRHPYLRLPMLAGSRHDKARLMTASRAAGLGLSPAYPSSIGDIPDVRSVTGGRRFPVAERLASELVTLPTHQWVSEKDKFAIVACVDALRPARPVIAPWSKVSRFHPA